MKKLHALTNQDLLEMPIWRYEGDSDDNAVVYPEDDFKNPDQVYIARTKFILTDGTIMFGYCSPTDDSGLDYIQPVIVNDSGHAKFWYDNEISETAKSKYYDVLGKNHDEIFPVQYECLVKYNNKYIKGKILELGS